jgi:DinB superfamily
MRMLLIAVLAVSATVSLRSAGLTPLERSHLVAHLEMTGSWLIDEVSDLSQEQLAFRPSSAAWSIMEVLEHLIVVGPIYWSDLQQAVRGRPSKRLLTTGDADILWYGIDRTRREIAIPSEKPPGRLRDVRTALEAYRTQHAQLLDYARTTKDDLRSHVVDRQQCDAYQWALLISTHEQRHVLQIREIKAHPSFPTK